MERKSIQKYHTIFSIEEGKINQFFQVYDTFQYLLPLLEHQPAENVEWRMVFNNWLFFSTEDTELRICPTKSKVHNPTSVLFQELLKRPLMKQTKWEVMHNEQYTFIAAVTISMEVLNWYKQSVHIKKDEFQIISTILTDYVKGIQNGQECKLVKMTSMLMEQMTANSNLTLELDYCLMDAMVKAKKLYELFYDKKDFSCYKEMQYTKLC
ncbi:hypothetical protein P9B03_01900 [Metasolibacillus meyeri]|uniref:AraC family transcriptional regulator n=1 Tax=Metasolibacillus meyeri TaxID=1071052 RepID=A0AAW9NNC4_9BACL|nr:hypothetical protein [Metasolibacillus meyeri]MEC1177223.1 hypothetical protein [Metasolibacillus meyeri]